MGEDLALNNYMKCTEKTCPVGRIMLDTLPISVRAIQKKSLMQKIRILFVKTYPSFKLLHATKTKNCLNALDLPFMMPKNILTTLRRGSK